MESKRAKSIYLKEAVTVANEAFIKWICKYGCPAIIHTDMGKEFINKISTESMADSSNGRVGDCGPKGPWFKPR